jgi:superfamily II DNA/RNA helicase
MVYNADKNALCSAVLKQKNLSSVVIFAGTRQKVKELEKDLKRAGINASAIHSDLTQTDRENVLNQFKNKKIPVLVATDVLSRGIDIDNINLVINYDVPGDAEDYIHRIGRTARAENTGEALTFISESEQIKFKSIEDLIEATIPKLALPVGFKEGPKYNPVSKNNSSHKSKNKFNRK